MVVRGGGGRGGGGGGEYNWAQYCSSKETAHYTDAGEVIEVIATTVVFRLLVTDINYAQKKKNSKSMFEWVLL